MYAAARVRHREGLGFSAGSAFDFPHHLAEVEFGDHECLRRRSKFTNAFFWKGPAGNQAEFADAETLLPGQFNRPLRYARRYSVGNNHDVSIVEAFFFEQRDQI